MGLLKKTFKAVTKPFKSVAKAPFDLIRSAGRGDFSGILDAGFRMGSYGTVGNDGVLNTSKVLPTADTAKAEANKELNKINAEEALQKQLADETYAAEMEKKRKSGSSTKTIFAGAMKKPLGGMSNILG